MFLSREIDIKLCQNSAKIHIYIYTIFYKSSRYKQIIIFNKYATNLKTIISHRGLRISGLLLLQFLDFYFAFLVDIIDNIITYSPYSPYYVTRTSANGSALSLSCDSETEITWPVYCTAIGFSSGDLIQTVRTKCYNIINYIYCKCKKKYKKSKPEIIRLL